MSVELLAPAKNIRIAKSAIDCGADAVYIGANSFGARKNAANPIEDIKELCKYAHKFYAKVYATVNTIVADNEIEDVKKLITALYNAGVDALIVQDMAIIKMGIDKTIPPIPLHISTQCDNRLDEKIKIFNDIGVQRVVLARELSIKDIERIHKYNPDLELETFVHGALCVSYSGQCYLSCYIGGRSANKGECAQPCRKKYTLVDETGTVLEKEKHLLCLKDFNASNRIKELIDAGVKSFKIEGRLKDELYVKNVIGYYRKLIDTYTKKTSSGTVDLGFEPDLNKSFNRGYTEYFLNGREKCFNFNSPKFIGEKIGEVKSISKNHFTISMKNGIILHPQDGLCFDICAERGCLINKIEGDNIYPNKMPAIKSGDTVFRNIDSGFEKRVLKSGATRKITAAIEYKNYRISAVDEDNNKVFADIEEREPANNPEKMKDNFRKSLSKTGDTDFCVTDINITGDVPFVPISKINEYRRILFNKLIEERLRNYERETQPELRYVKYFTDTLDYRANVHNSAAKEFYKKCGTDVTEMSFESGKPNRRVELMRTKHCIKYALNMCKSSKKLFLVDDKGQKYPLVFDCKNCEMAILSP